MLIHDMREDLRLISLSVYGNSSFKSQLRLFLFYDAVGIIMLHRIRKALPSMLGLHTMIRIFMLVRYNVEISVKAEIGHGAQFVHSGIVVGDDVRIGKNCRMYGSNTLGSARGLTGMDIGDNVEIGAGARILGPLTVGSNVLIGANAVVLKDVPEGCMAVGVPARVIRGRK